MKVGFVVMLGENPVLGRAPTYVEVRDLVLQAEDAGFDSVWLWDHLIYRQLNQPQRGHWECWTMLSALAGATTRIELGTLVLCTPLRNPAVLAKMAVTLDEVSAGRFTLGLGAGWNKPEFDAFGVPFDHRVGRFEEALQIICPLLREGVVDFAGEYYQAPDCAILPPGPRSGGPPILVAANGPRMLRLTAQYADSWNVVELAQPEGLMKPRAALHAACVAVGRDPATIAVTAGVSVAYPDLETPPRALDTYLHGTPEEIAAAFLGYEREGVSHIMIKATPSTATTLTRLTDVLHAYRRMSNA